jgi:hypothetical protein
MLIGWDRESEKEVKLCQSPLKFLSHYPQIILFIEWAFLVYKEIPSIEE